MTKTPRLCDRFIDPRVINFISRPQYPEACSIAALTCVVNYLYADHIGIQTTETLARLAGIDIETVGAQIDPGNEDLSEWFTRLTRSLGVKGRSSVLIDGAAAADQGFDKAFARLRRALHSNTSVVICHRDVHYNLVCGYFEQAAEPDKAYFRSPEGQRWILLADHSSSRDPIYCVRWGDLLAELSDDPDYALLNYERK